MKKLLVFAIVFLLVVPCFAADDGNIPPPAPIGPNTDLSMRSATIGTSSLETVGNDLIIKDANNPAGVSLSALVAGGDPSGLLNVMSALTGGAAGALDALPVAGLNEGDVRMTRVISGTNVTVYVHVFDDDGTSSESSPTAIRPDDYATAGVWRLALMADQDLSKSANVVFSTINVTGAGVTVVTEAYDEAGWNGDNTVPTKDAVRDKIESMSSITDLDDLPLDDTDNNKVDHDIVQQAAEDCKAAAPGTPFEGQEVCADGNNWQPGGEDQGTDDWIVRYRTSDTTWVGVYNITDGAFLQQSAASAPTVQADDPTSASADGWYLATTSGDAFYKSAAGLFNVSAGTYTADPTPPTITGTTIGTGGIIWELTATEAITAGAGGSGGMSGNCTTAGAITLTYSAGDGTTTPEYSGDPIVYQDDNCTITYAQPGNGWEDGDGDDLASFAAAAVTNGSTESAVVNLITNGDFATNSCTSWTTNGLSCDASDGAATLTNTSYGTFRQDDIGLVQGTTYNYSFDVVSIGATNVIFQNGITAVLTISSTGPKTGAFVCVAASPGIRFLFNGNTAGHTFKVDNVQVWE